MGEAKKSAVGKLVKDDPNKPAVFVEGKTMPVFDPAEKTKALGLWRLNGKDRYFEVRDEPLPVIFHDKNDVARLLRIEGVSDKSAPGKFSSDMDTVFRHIQSERQVDYAGPLCGKRVGVVEAQGRRILVTSSYRLIEPVAGEWSRLRALLEGLLEVEEADQLPWFFAWLKTAIESLRKGRIRPGHALILAGPSDCGKSFIQQHVITPLLGGRLPADPTKYLTNKTTFNAELFSSEHLVIQELPSGLDFPSRLMLAEELKRMIASENHALHMKYGDALTVYPWWRVSLSINDSVDKLRALPPLSSDFGDKVLVLRCESHPENLSGPSDEDRAEFLEAITLELPAFVAFLLEYEIPATLRQTKHAARFGHDHFHNPRLTTALFEQEPESALLYLLDNCHTLYDAALVDCQGVTQGDAWGWKSQEALKDELCAMSEAAKALFESKKGGFHNACGTFLRRLRERFPQRIEFAHTSKGNVWLIYAPPDP